MISFSDICSKSVSLTIGVEKEDYGSSPECGTTDDDRELWAAQCREQIDIITYRLTANIRDIIYENTVDELLTPALKVKTDNTKDPLVLIEQRLDFSSYVPDGFGTGDAVLLAPGKLHVIDFKYGQGVLVEAEHNSQMMLYALAALKKYSRKYKVKRVSMSIFQPRRENVSTWTITATELRKWASSWAKRSLKRSSYLSL